MKKLIISFVAIIALVTSIELRANDNPPTVRAALPKGAVQDGFESSLKAYFDIQVALSEDDLERAGEGASRLLQALSGVSMKEMPADLHVVWMKSYPRLKASTDAVKIAANLGDAREAFEAMSLAMLNLVRNVDYTGDVPVYQYHCPMAFQNKGADWLQDKEGTANPYFGAAMYRCGKMQAQIHKTPAGGAR